MMPIACLMIEHRLIDRMIAVMGVEAARIREGRVNAGVVAEMVDFFTVYVDRCHHGKEEDILFRALTEKDMSSGHKRIMKELLEEHSTGRGIIRRLSDARDSYLQGDDSAKEDILAEAEKMLALYPPHIEKEDRHFFIPAMKYLSSEDQGNMLAEMDEFDRRFVHSFYEEMLGRLERKSG